MNLIVLTVLSLIGYFILMIITSNLTGMVVRGFFVQDTDFEDFIKKGRPRPYTTKGVSMGERADKRITIVFSIIAILFLYLLYRFLNIWAIFAALLLVFSRVPDLIWEIKVGKKVTLKEKPKGGIYSFTGILVIVALPVLWWSLYNLFVL